MSSEKKLSLDNCATYPEAECDMCGIFSALAPGSRVRWMPGSENSDAVSGSLCICELASPSELKKPLFIASTAVSRVFGSYW